MICAFFALGLVILAALSSMFASVLYRWTFQNFPFFANMTITAFVFLVSTLALAVACRINFGKDLPQYCTCPTRLLPYFPTHVFTILTVPVPLS